MGQIVQDNSGSEDFDGAQRKEDQNRKPSAAKTNFSSVHLTKFPIQQPSEFRFERVQELICNIPLYEKSPEIISALRNGRGSNFGIMASTGTGKSIVAPLLAALETGERITVYVPKRSAAYGLATYVSSILGTQLGSLIGYSAGSDRIFSNERADKLGHWSQKTRVLYTTYGVGALYEHYNRQYRSERTIFLDEIHDPSLETLHTISALMRQIDLGAKLQLIPMSADWNTQKLTNFFELNNLVEYKASRYPIIEGVITQSPVDEAVSQIKQGNTVLYYERDFVHCKRTLSEIVKKLIASNTPHQALHYHAQASPKEKMRINNINSTPPAIILSTDAAQDSLTLPVDVVINSGFVKRPIEVSRREELVIEPTSESEDLQRKGRVGRLAGRNAIYFNYSPTDSEKSRYPIPIIQRVVPVTTLLMLKDSGRDFKSYNAHLIDQPTERGIQLAEIEARKIGAISLTGEITPLGRKLVSLGIQPTYGAFIINATKRATSSGLSPDEIEQVKFCATRVVALYSVGHLTLATDNSNASRLPSQNYDSDLFAQIAYHKMATHLPDRKLDELGIVSAKVATADTILSMLINKFSLDAKHDIISPSTEKIIRETLLLSAGNRIVLFARSKDQFNNITWRDLSSSENIYYKLRDGTSINQKSSYLLGVAHENGKFAFIEFGMPYNEEDLYSLKPSQINTKSIINNRYDPIYPARFKVIVKSFGDLNLSSQHDNTKLRISEMTLRGADWIISALKGESACGPWGLNKAILNLSLAFRSHNVDYDKLKEKLSKKIKLDLTGRILNDSQIEELLIGELEAYSSLSLNDSPVDNSTESTIKIYNLNQTDFSKVENELNQPNLSIQCRAASNLLKSLGIERITEIFNRNPLDIINSADREIRPLLSKILSKALTILTTYTSETREYLTREQSILTLHIASKIDPTNTIAISKIASIWINSGKNQISTQNIKPEEVGLLRRYTLDLLITHFDKCCELSPTKLAGFEQFSSNDLRAISDNCDLISRLSQLALLIGTETGINSSDNNFDQHAISNIYLNWAFWCAKCIEHIRIYTDSSSIDSSSLGNLQSRAKTRAVKVLDELKKLNYTPPINITPIHLTDDLNLSQDLTQKASKLQLANIEGTGSTQPEEVQLTENSLVLPITTYSSVVFGYKFTNPELLKSALSTLPIGDKLLSLSTRTDNNRNHPALKRALTNLIVKAYPDVNTEQISIMLDFVYRPELLSIIYSRDNLSHLIEVNGGIQLKSEDEKYCDKALKIVEFIFNQIESDSDLSNCVTIANTLLGRWIPLLDKLKNPKEELVKYCKQNNLLAPRFQQKNIAYKDGGTICTSRVSLGDITLEAKGPSFLSAELQAARSLLDQLNIRLDDQELVLEELAQLEEEPNEASDTEVEASVIDDIEPALDEIAVKEEKYIATDPLAKPVTSINISEATRPIPEVLEPQDPLVDILRSRKESLDQSRTKRNIEKNPFTKLFISETTLNFLKSLNEQDAEKLLATFGTLKNKQEDIATLSQFLTNNYPDQFGTDTKNQILETTVRGMLIEDEFIKQTLRSLHLATSSREPSKILTDQDLLTVGEIKRKVTSQLIIPTIRRNLSEMKDSRPSKNVLLDFIGGNSTLTLGLQDLFDRAVCLEKSASAKLRIQRAFSKAQSIPSIAPDRTAPDQTKSELILHDASIHDLTSPNQSSKFIQLTNDASAVILGERLVKLDNVRSKQILKEVFTLTKYGGMIFIVLNNDELTPGTTRAGTIAGTMTGTRAHFLKTFGISENTLSARYLCNQLRSFGAEVEVSIPSIQISASNLSEKLALLATLNYWTPNNVPIIALQDRESYLDEHTRSKDDPIKYILTINQTIIIAKKVSKPIQQISTTYGQLQNQIHQTLLDTKPFIETHITRATVSDGRFTSEPEQTSTLKPNQPQPVKLQVDHTPQLDKLMDTFINGSKLNEYEFTQLKKLRGKELYQDICTAAIRPILIAHQEIFPDDDSNTLKFLGDLAYLANLEYLPYSRAEAIFYTKQEVSLGLWRAIDGEISVPNLNLNDLYTNSSELNEYRSMASKFFREAPFTPLISIMQGLYNINPILNFIFRNRLIDNHTNEQIAVLTGLPNELVNELFNQAISAIGPKGRMSKLAQTQIRDPILRNALASPTAYLDIITDKNNTLSELKKHTVGAHHFTFSPLGDLLY